MVELQSIIEDSSTINSDLQQQVGKKILAIQNSKKSKYSKKSKIKAPVKDETMVEEEGLPKSKQPRPQAVKDASGFAMVKNRQKVVQHEINAPDPLVNENAKNIKAIEDMQAQLKLLQDKLSVS